MTDTTEAPQKGPPRPGALGGLLTTEQACEYLNVSRTTLYAWASRHRVRRVVVNALVRWPRAELDRMVQASLKTRR